MNIYFKKIAYLFITITIVLANQLMAEQISKNSHKHEISLGVISTHFIKEKENALGWQLHYIRSLGKTDFGIGIGYERILDGHGYNTLGFIFNLKPIENWSINLIPGIAYHDGGLKHIEFAFHFESIYEFKIESLHIGPLIDYSFEEDENHISLGIHFGFGL